MWNDRRIPPRTPKIVQAISSRLQTIKAKRAPLTRGDIPRGVGIQGPEFFGPALPPSWPVVQAFIPVGHLFPGGSSAASGPPGEIERQGGVRCRHNLGL